MTGVIETDANGVIQTDANGVIQTVSAGTAQFDVTIAATNSPVNPGDVLDVTVDVTNSGGASDTQTVTLSINIDNSVGQVDSQPVSLGSGQSTTLTLSWSTDGDQTPQDYQATVASDDDSVSQTVTVSSGPSLPSSAIHRWKLDDISTGTATDSIGSADGTVNGVSSISGTYQGGAAGDGDGTDDYIDVGALGAFGSELNSFAVALTIKSTANDIAIPFGVQTGGGAPRLRATVNQDAEFNTVDGAISLGLRDDNKTRIRATVNPDVTDGNKYRIVFNVIDASSNNYDIFVNNTNEAITARDENNPSTFSGFGRSMYLFANNGTGGAGNLYDGVLDDIIFYSSSLSASEITDDYNLQPWV